MVRALLDNSRFYITSSALILSAAVFAWLRLHTASDQLLIIQTEQSYGLIAISCLYITLIISPLRIILGTTRTELLLYARRGFGLATFYFALLHAVIALWGQLGGVSALHLLPPVFQQALLYGGCALAILTLMAATPSDQLIPRIISYRWWKRIHRLVYGAGILIVLHVWMIGTHLTIEPVRLLSFCLLMILFGLESFRFTSWLNRESQYFGRTEMIILSLILWAVIGLFLALLPTMVANYHGHMEHM